jgi:hypothetical protein
MNESHVMQVFFDSEGVDPFFFMKFDKTKPLSPFGVPLVVNNGQPVGRWAIDYIACGDQRWLLFGPFQSKHEARQSLVTIRAPEDSILGYRIWMTHCFTGDVLQYQGERHGNALRFAAWTDG